MKILSVALCALLVTVSFAADEPAQKPANVEPAKKPADKLEKKTAPVYQKNKISRDGAHHHHHDHAPAAPSYGAAPPPPAPPAYAPQQPAYAPPQPAAYAAPQQAYAPAPAAPAYSAPAPAAYSAPAPAPAYSAPAPAAYQAPAAPAYQAPAAPAYEQPAAYAAPAEAQASYAAPAQGYEAAPAPVYNAPANQGYYYYYYPVKAGKGKAELPKLPKSSLSLKGMWDGLKTHATDLYNSLPSFSQVSAYAKKDEETTLLGLGVAAIVLLIISVFLLISVPLVDPNNFSNFNLFKPINLSGIGLPNISFNKFNLQGLLGRSANFHFSDYFTQDTLNSFASYVLNALDEVEAKQAASQ